MNQDHDIVIIGCGAGGGTAAQFARKTDRKSSVTIIEQSNYPQYSKCGLPYVVSGIIPNHMDLVEFSERWFKNANIDLLLSTIVETIDVKKQVVIAKKANTKIEKSYGSLIICTGAKTSIPNIANIKDNNKLVDGVFTVRTIDDIKSISQYVQKGKNATIIGAGFIGLEMADNLYKKEMKITLVETLPYIMSGTFDEDISKYVQQKIPNDITFFTNHHAIKIEKRNIIIFN